MSFLYRFDFPVSRWEMERQFASGLHAQGSLCRSTFWTRCLSLPLCFCQRQDSEQWFGISSKIPMVHRRKNSYKFCSYCWCSRRGTKSLHHIYSAVAVWLCLYNNKRYTTLSYWLVDNQVYWPKNEDIGKFLKVECIPILRETEYPPVFAVSCPVSPGTSNIGTNITDIMFW